MADDLARPVDVVFPLSIEEANLLRCALEGHVASRHEHYLEDGGATHAPEEWEDVRVSTGQLLWRLEEAAVLPWQAVQHSAYAVEPPPEEQDGGAGVREPRRPRPSAPPAHAPHPGPSGAEQDLTRGTSQV